MTAPADPPVASDLTSTSVSSGGSASPPRRSRRTRPAPTDRANESGNDNNSGRSGNRSGNQRGRSVSSVSATVAAPAPIAVPADDAPAEAELTDDDTGQTTRARRKQKPPKQPKQAKQPKPAKQPKTRPVATGPRSERRFRQTIMKVDLWTVLKLSLCFYLSLMFIILIAIVALWMVAEAAGIIDSVEKFLGDLLSAKDFTFLSGEVLRGAILVSLVMVALQVVITVIAASFYNIFAELFGGLEITIKEQEASDR